MARCLRRNFGVELRKGWEWSLKKKGGNKKAMSDKKKKSQGVCFLSGRSGKRCTEIKYKPAPKIWLSLLIFSDYAEANIFTVSLHRWTQETGRTHSDERNGEGGGTDSSRQMITQMRGKEKTCRTERGNMWTEGRSENTRQRKMGHTSNITQMRQIIKCNAFPPSSTSMNWPVDSNLASRALVLVSLDCSKSSSQ